MTGRYVLSPRAQTDLGDIWDYTAFLDVLRADDRIITCAAVTGECDLTLEVAVKDVADLTDLTLDTPLKLPTVRDVFTCLSLRSYKTAGEVDHVF
jgi:Lrp/AsnC family leucine-responsive transcriptional regulator